MSRRLRRRMGELLAEVRRASADRGPLLQLWDLAAHKVKINTSPVDYYRYEFYRTRDDWDTKSRYVGKRGSAFYPYSNNPRKYEFAFRDKYVFRTLLAGLRLPQPTLLATIGPRFDIRDERAFGCWARQVPSDFVLKPMRGSGGRGITVVEVQEGGLRKGGQPVDCVELWNRISSSRFREAYLAEERVRNAPGLAALYPGTLNTFRVTTIRTDDGCWHVASVVLRLGRAGQAVDNLGAGNIAVAFDERGESTRAFDWRERVFIRRHPDTGAGLVGVRPEGFSHVVGLALSASCRFSFMGILGWDIAQTERGPVIIEANAFPDAGYFQYVSGCGWISDQIKAGLPRRGPFTRWDPRYMFPGHRG